MLRVSTLLLVLFAVTGCGVNDIFGPKSPPLPAGAQPITPFSQYDTWWAEVEQCSGMKRDMSEIQFYMVPDRLDFEYKGDIVVGVYTPHYAITMADYVAESGPQVRHEMLHAIKKDHKRHHDPLYFGEKCGGKSPSDGQRLVSYDPNLDP